MNQVLDDKMELYLSENTTDIHPYLNLVERNTHLNMVHSHMISGAYQGKLLSLISKMINAKHILEVGTFTAFSTLVFASVVPEDGHVHSIEADLEILETAKQNIIDSPWANKITLHAGQATDVIPDLLRKLDFDLIFIDADKKNNKTYFDLLIDQVKSGTILLVDNVLWKGKVLQDKKDNTTKIIDDFNTYVKNDNRVEVILLPIRDGLSLIRKN